jgi:hypothetical protein
VAACTSPKRWRICLYSIAGCHIIEDRNLNIYYLLVLTTEELDLNVGFQHLVAHQRRRKKQSPTQTHTKDDKQIYINNNNNNNNNSEDSSSLITAGCVMMAILGLNM